MKGTFWANHKRFNGHDIQGNFTLFQKGTVWIVKEQMGELDTPILTMQVVALPILKGMWAVVDDKYTWVDWREDNINKVMVIDAPDLKSNFKQWTTTTLYMNIQDIDRDGVQVASGHRWIVKGYDTYHGADCIAMTPIDLDISDEGVLEEDGLLFGVGEFDPLDEEYCLFEPYNPENTFQPYEVDLLCNMKAQLERMRVSKTDQYRIAEIRNSQNGLLAPLDESISCLTTMEDRLNLLLDYLIEDEDKYRIKFEEVVPRTSLPWCEL